MATSTPEAPAVRAPADEPSVNDATDCVDESMFRTITERWNSLDEQDRIEFYGRVMRSDDAPEEQPSAAPVPADDERARTLGRIGKVLDRLAPSTGEALAENLEGHVDKPDWERCQFNAILWLGPCVGEWYAAGPAPDGNDTRENESDEPAPNSNDSPPELSPARWRQVNMAIFQLHAAKVIMPPGTDGPLDSAIAALEPFLEHEPASDSDDSPPAPNPKDEIKGMTPAEWRQIDDVLRQVNAAKAVMPPDVGESLPGRTVELVWTALDNAIAKLEQILKHDSAEPVTDDTPAATSALPSWSDERWPEFQRVVAALPGVFGKCNMTELLDALVQAVDETMMNQTDNYARLMPLTDLIKKLGTSEGGAK